MKGYKAFDKDFTCRGFQYDVGNNYETEEKIALCDSGFHFCKKIADCFRYYQQADARFAEVEAYGEVIESDDDSKCVTDKIRIVREIPRQEAVDMSNAGNGNTGRWNTGNGNTGDGNTGNRNTGHWNTGHGNTGHWNTGGCNTGHWNTGNRNTGHWNTGNRNTGHCNTGNWNTGNRNTGDCNTGNWNTGGCNTGHGNTGDWNTGDRNTGDWNVADGSSGCFCTEEPKIKLFDKDTNMTFSDWRASEACGILSRMPMVIQEVEWVAASEMTAEEKENNPTHETTGGFLKTIDRNDSRQDWWDNLSETDKETVMAIPNFDADKFRQCTGIMVEGEGRTR